jgi:hypothetical protein
VNINTLHAIACIARREERGERREERGARSEERGVADIGVNNARLGVNINTLHAIACIARSQESGVGWAI